MWKIIEKDDLFAKPNKQLSLDEEREITFKRLKRLTEYDLLPDNELMGNPLGAVGYQDAVYSYDPAVFQAGALSASVSVCVCTVEYTLYYTVEQVFGGAIRGSGKLNQFHFYEKAYEYETFCCFSLTELSHGSNAGAIRTTATFDPNTQVYY